MDIITEGKLKAGMEFIKLARQYGAKLVRSKKHNVFRDAAGHQITAPKTTSDYRAIKNFEAELRGRGFVKQDTVRKVKDSLVNKSKETVLKPTVKQPVSRQTTFSDFTRKYQPNVQGPKRSELQVQGDHIINTIRAKAKRKSISKAQLDAMNIPQKEKDKLIKQGLVNEGVLTEGAALALKLGSNLVPKIMTGIGAAGTIFQASKADKERRKQLAKDHNLDITKPGDRAKLGRLLKKDTEAKKRADKGDTRSQEQYRQEKAENRKTIDATRQSMGQSKAKPGTKERAEIDKKLKDFRDELRDVTNDPIVPSRAKVRVKVGQEVPKPDNTLPKRTGASPQKVRDRRSYEAQQRRNLKENKFRVAAQLMRKAGVRNYDDLVRVVNAIKQQAGDKIIRSAVKSNTDDAALRAASRIKPKETADQLLQRIDPSAGVKPVKPKYMKPVDPKVKGKVQGPESELANRMARAYDKNKGLFDEQLAQEQMVVPRSIKKKNPLMTVKTEMEILKQLSNRKAAYDRARTGKPMYPFSEDNKHRDDKLNYQYKDVTNPKKPVDPIKVLKLKKV